MFIKLSAAVHELSSSQRNKKVTRLKTILSSLARAVINSTDTMSNFTF